MRRTAYIILTCLATFLLHGCGHKTRALEIFRLSSACDINGVDSLETYSVGTDTASASPLFHIAKGGQIECIADTVVTLDGIRTALFTLADFSQEDQIFYILFRPDTDSIFQSGRVNLPLLGNSIAEYRKLTIDRISAGSMRVGNGTKSISVRTLRLDCDSNRIINYYEYQ
jgi:hypothetical protein